LAERLPVEDAWADMGISKGVINLWPTSERSSAAVLRHRQTAIRFRPLLSTMSTFGRLELPVCRVQLG